MPANVAVVKKVAVPIVQLVMSVAAVRLVLANVAIDDAPVSIQPVQASKLQHILFNNTILIHTFGHRNKKGNRRRQHLHCVFSVNIQDVQTRDIDYFATSYRSFYS